MQVAKICMSRLHTYKKKVTEGLNSVFSHIPVLEKSTKFVQRKSDSLSSDGFIVALLKSVVNGNTSCTDIASFLSLSHKKSQSRQAVHKRMKKKESLKFLKEVLKKATKEKCELIKKEGLCEFFKRILLEDSTQLKLKKSNAKHFPSHGNQNGKTSGIKCNFIFDLLTGNPVYQKICKATKPDQGLSTNAIRLLRKGDLLIRDMGYFVISGFKKIEDLGAYWLSRCPITVEIRTEDGKLLEDYLKTSTLSLIDIPVKVGKEDKHHARLIAVRADDCVANSRRRERRKQAKKQGRAVSKNALIREGWHIILTNIESKSLKAVEVFKLYSLRWQIEITFRAWKQSGNLEKALNRKSNKYHLGIIIHAAILWLVLGAKVMTLAQRINPQNKVQKFISIEKLFKHLSIYLFSIKQLSELGKFEPPLNLILHESRSRNSMPQRLFAFLSLR